MALRAEGDYIKVTASKYPFPTVCAEERSVDWFQSISRTLRWNEREKQKSFVVVEEDRPKPVKGKASKNVEEPPKQNVHDDDIRVKASRQEAQDGQDSLDKKAAEEGTRQASQRGEKAEDGGSEETSEDEEEEEEEEAFDIDE